MLFILIGLSVLLVLVAVGAYGFGPTPFLLRIGLVAVPCFLFSAFSMQTLWLIFPCVVAAWAVCRWRDASRSAFAGWAAASVAAGWVVAMAAFVPRWREIERLAADYPVVRIDQRLGYERQAAERLNLTAVEKAKPSYRGQIESLPSDDELAEAAGHHYGARSDDRLFSLASLERTHRDFAQAFASQGGFGLIRMRHLPARDEFIRLPEREPRRLPPPPTDSSSAGTADPASPIEQTDDLREFHVAQAVDFLNRKGFGRPLDGTMTGFEFEGRVGSTRVRGFQPHAFKELPAGSPLGEEWQLTRLELLSLLKHDPPAVYVSEHLPRMEELASATAATRPLDGFETAALDRLREGETVVAERGRNRVSMLGGLRAARACTQCHAVSEGHLLGAFRYEFRRKTPLLPTEDAPPPKPVT